MIFVGLRFDSAPLPQSIAPSFAFSSATPLTRASTPLSAACLTYISLYIGNKIFLRKKTFSAGLGSVLRAEFRNDLRFSLSCKISQLCSNDDFSMKTHKDLMLFFGYVEAADGVDEKM